MGFSIRIRPADNKIIKKKLVVNSVTSSKLLSFTMPNSGKVIGYKLLFFNMHVAVYYVIGFGGINLLASLVDSLPDTENAWFDFSG